MLRSRFFWKLLASYGALAIGLATAVAWLGAGTLQRQAIADSESALSSHTALLADIVAPLLERPEPAAAAAWQERVTRLGAESRLRLTVIAVDGRVLADSDHAPATMDDHARRPEVVAALRDGTGSITRQSPTLAVPMFYFARRVERDGRPIGIVRAAQAQAAIEASIADLTRTVIGASAVAALAATALIMLLTRRFTAALQDLRAAAQDMAAGGATRRVEPQTRDEIGDLALAFNTMANELHARFEAMQREQNKLHSILGGMVEGVLAVDGSECLVHVNDVAARMLSLSGPKAIGARVWEATRFPRLGDTVARTLATGEPETAELTLHGQGRDRVVELRTTALRDAQGRIAGAVAVLHDVSELRRLEKMRRDFVSNVSHELKTPLTAIRGIADTLLDDATMDSETRTRFLERLRVQAERLTMLVTDLLRLSRVESGESVAEHEMLDLRQPVQESFRALLAVAEKKGLRAELAVSETPLLVLGDAEGLRQVVDNLVSNAITYTPSGGRIAVRLRRDETHALLEVEDTGIGIERQHLDRIFERFYRVDTARSREVGGTGLGLSIVKHVVLAHSGEVGVDSKPGIGTVFRVRLPLAAEAMAEADLRSVKSM